MISNEAHRVESVTDSKRWCSANGRHVWNTLVECRHFWKRRCITPPFGCHILQSKDFIPRLLLRRLHPTLSSLVGSRPASGNSRKGNFTADLGQEVTFNKSPDTRILQSHPGGFVQYTLLWKHSPRRDAALWTIAKSNRHGAKPAAESRRHHILSRNADPTTFT